MKTRIVYNSKIVFWINYFRNKIGLGPIGGISLYPYMLFTYEKTTLMTLRHENIHFLQIEKYGFFTFYISYLFYYLINLLVYRDHNKAYMNIPWEIEAYKLADKKSIN